MYVQCALTSNLAPCSKMLCVGEFCAAHVTPTGIGLLKT